MGFVTMVVVSPIRNFDIYDIEGGMRALTEQPALVVGGQVVFAWAGVAFIIMILAFHERQPGDARPLMVKVATAFGLIAGTLLLFFGLVGGFAYYELIYLQATRSAAYVQEVYLPLTIVMNRVHIAAIATSGIWFFLTNWIGLQDRALPQPMSYVGLGAGGIAMLGFVLPGGGFGLLSSLLGVIWAIWVSIRVRRTNIRPSLQGADSGSQVGRVIVNVNKDEGS
jgi:hypothetical protein